MLRKGTTFIRDGHVWFALTEPRKGDDGVLCVNLTTLDADCPDDECVLNHSDYNWIKENHPTSVAFSRARIWDAEKIERCLADGHLQKPVPGDVSKKLVERVIRAAKNSKELSADKKAML